MLTMEQIILIVAGASALFSLIAMFTVFGIAKSAKKNGKVLKEIAQKPATVLEKVSEVKTANEKEEVAVTSAPVEEAVTFSADKGKSLEEKYADLSAENKAFYDEIASYASAVEGAKRFKNLRYEEYKIGSMRIVRMLIKRDIIFCEFMLQNSNIRSYTAGTKVSVKQAATVIKVTDATAVGAVKNTIDIAVKGIAEEKELKKQIAREKRREKRSSKQA